MNLNDKINNVIVIKNRQTGWKKKAKAKGIILLLWQETLLYILSLSKAKNIAQFKSKDRWDIYSLKIKITKNSSQI